MMTIFGNTFSSRTGLGDIGVTVDPFTGEICTYMPAVARYPGGPVVSRDTFLDGVRQQILKGLDPYAISPQLHDLKDTFNVGVAHVPGGYVMLVRFQNASRFNHVFLARSSDGIHWAPNPRLLKLPDLPLAPAREGIRGGDYDIAPGTKWHPGIFYDPRITQMDDGTYLIALAVDYDTIAPPGQPYINICDNVLYRTRDFESFEFVSVMAGNARNCVLFPRRIDGWYYAAGRPNTAQRVHTALLRSRDLGHWEEAGELFAGGHGWMIYAGPGFPPFETQDCWVLGVHGVEKHGTFQVVYRAGVCLLDKKTLRVVAGPVPILHPEQQYEMDGVVDNVIFPTGVLFSDGSGCGVKGNDVKVAIYYGAADSVVGVGLTTVGRLIEAAQGRYNPFTRG